MTAKREDRMADANRLLDLQYNIPVVCSCRTPFVLRTKSVICGTYTSIPAAVSAERERHCLSPRSCTSVTQDRFNQVQHSPAPCPGGGEAPAEGRAGAGRRLWASARSFRLSVGSGRGDGPCHNELWPTSPHSPFRQNPPGGAHSPPAPRHPAQPPPQSCSSPRSPSWW